MNDIQRERTIEEAKYILENQCTIRECAKALGVSKSTVHLDLQKRLNEIDKGLYLRVYMHIRKNIKFRSIRGGFATQRKYKEIRGL